MLGVYYPGQVWPGRAPDYPPIVYVASYEYVAIVPYESRTAVVRQEPRTAVVPYEPREGEEIR